jgi:hypothetical protein
MPSLSQKNTGLRVCKDNTIYAVCTKVIFKCCFDVNKTLVRRDGPRRNSDNITYTFTCGFGCTAVVLLCRQNMHNDNNAGGPGKAVYYFYVRKGHLEESLPHFKCSFELQKRNTSIEKLSSNSCSIECITRTVVAREGEVTERIKVEEKETGTFW